MAAFGGGQEAKALEFKAEGEKCLKKWSLFSSSTKYEDAAECFDKAARCYKVRHETAWDADTSAVPPTSYYVAPVFLCLAACEAMKLTAGHRQFYESK